MCFLFLPLESLELLELSELSLDESLSELDEPLLLLDPLELSLSDEEELLSLSLSELS